MRTVLHRTSSGIQVQQQDGVSITLPVASGTTVALVADGPVVEVCCGTCGFAIATGTDLDLQVLESEPKAAG